MFYLTMHSTHFIYGYMASDIWLRTILIVRKETRCRHIGYSYRLTARVLLYAPSHRQDNTYHGLCYTSCGALAGTRNSSMGYLTLQSHLIGPGPDYERVMFNTQGRSPLISHYLNMRQLRTYKQPGKKVRRTEIAKMPYPFLIHEHLDVWFLWKIYLLTLEDVIF